MTISHFRTALRAVAAAALLIPALSFAADDAASPAAGSAAPLSSTDQRFVQKAAQGGLAEVQLGQLAAQKAASQQVRMLGEQMARDHGQAHTELQRLAASKGIGLPKEPSEEHREKLADLQEQSGRDFDRSYTDFMVKEHDKDIEEFEQQSENGSDPQLKAYAAKTLPVLRAHREHAESTRSAVESRASTSRAD